MEDHEHLSALESVPEAASESNPYKEDRINSGESKFKYYSFEPNSTRTTKDIERCLDFWKFINRNTELFPQAGTKISTRRSTDDSQQEEELNWSNVLDLLKAKHLDKVARYAKTHKKLCKIARCSDEKPKYIKLGMKESEDDFDLNNLNDFNPQQKFFADKEIQTIEIIMKVKSAQTDFPSSKLRIERAMNQLDRLLKKVADKDLTGYFDCICDEKCEWLPYPTKTAPTDSETNKTAQKKSFLNKCTCSCGNIDCLCSLCDQILKEIENAQNSFNGLTKFEIEQCPCANISCACLEDYEKLLDIKLEINKAIVESIGDPNAEFHMPLRCQCSCNQLNCPCKIVTSLFIELDALMGYKEKPLYYSDEDLNLKLVADVCRCYDHGEENGPPCMCLSYFRGNIQSKIDEKRIPEVVPSVAKVQMNCAMSCLSECALGTDSPVCDGCIDDQPSDPPCLCEDFDCAKTDDTSESLIMVVSYNTDVPEVPPNSIAEN